MRDSKSFDESSGTDEGFSARFPEDICENEPTAEVLIGILLQVRPPELHQQELADLERILDFVRQYGERLK